MASKISETFPITIDEKGLEFISKKKIKSLFIDVDYMEEPCTQVFSPVIREKKNSTKLYQDLGNVSGVDIKYTTKLIEIFGIPESLHISVGGLLKKHLSVVNIDPIIKNVCKF